MASVRAMLAGVDDIAWAAGLFEGEGSIELRRNYRADSGRQRQTTRLHLGMTDLDVVEKFMAIAGCGAIQTRPRRPGWKTCYSWSSARADDVTRLLNLFLPYFGERRSARAKECLAFLAELEVDRHRVCFCGKPFYTQRTRKVTCSTACYDQHRRLLRTEWA